MKFEERYDGRLLVVKKKDRIESRYDLDTFNASMKICKNKLNFNCGNCQINEQSFI